MNDMAGVFFAGDGTFNGAYSEAYSTAITLGVDVCFGAGANKVDKAVGRATVSGGYKIFETGGIIESR